MIHQNNYLQSIFLTTNTTKCVKFISKILAYCSLPLHVFRTLRWGWYVQYLCLDMSSTLNIVPYFYMCCVYHYLYLVKNEITYMHLIFGQANNRKRIVHLNWRKPFRLIEQHICRINRMKHAAHKPHRWPMKLAVIFPFFFTKHAFLPERLITKLRNIFDIYFLKTKLITISEMQVMWIKLVFYIEFVECENFPTWGLGWKTD